MTAVVYQGDAGNLPLPDASVDLVVTSPPYFGLRNYTDGGAALDGQVGAESTPAEYLDALMACTAEWMRVLKPGGSIFVNLGDKYSQSASQWQGSRRGHGGELKGSKTDQATQFGQGAWNEAPAMGKPKSLIGLPWRYALRCIDELGLILRAEIVWAKPNGLPESVTDRVRRQHEQVFHFTKQPRYFSAIDEIREAYAPETANRYAAGYNARKIDSQRETVNTKLGGVAYDQNPLGKLPGSVWTIPTTPLRVPDELGIDHFAAYPPELVRRIVLGWSPREVCTACGEGRRPVVASQRCVDGEPVQDLGARRVGGYQSEASGISNGRYSTDRRFTGYACACPDTTAPSTPGVVLDPFGGTGTTALVASVHGRVGITVDLSADYCRLAHWRTGDDVQRARAARKPKPKPKAGAA